VKILRGELTTYEHRSDETDRWLRFEFCPKPQRFGWFRSAHPWVRPPEGVEIVQTSALPPPARKA